MILKIVSPYKIQWIILIFYIVFLNDFIFTIYFSTNIISPTTVNKWMNVQIQYYETLIISLLKVQLLAHFWNHKLAVKYK